MAENSKSNKDVKYFQKLKCECVDFSGAIHLNCINCKGSGIIAGADITSTIKPIWEGIDKELISDNVYRNIETNDEDAYFKGVIDAFRKAKQIIEDNIIVKYVLTDLKVLKYS